MLTNESAQTNTKDKPKRILIADDETDLLDIYSSLLAKAGWEIDSAADGDAAYKRLSSDPYDLLVSDMRMPHRTGLDLLAWANSTGSKTKVIVISGLLQPNEISQISMLGAASILQKPIGGQALVDAVRKVLVADAGTEFNRLLFGRVPIDDFITGKKVEHAVYIKLPGGKLLKLAHAGEDLPIERVVAFKQKGVTELWIDRDEYARYLRLNERILSVSSANPMLVSSGQRAQLVHHACDVAYEYFQLMGISGATFALSKSVLEMSMANLNQDTATGQLMETIAKRGRTEFSHASTCAMLAGAVAAVMGWTAKRNVSNLVLGAFFHDVGSSLIHGEEKGDPRLHPELGAEMLARVPSLPSEVIQIVRQHHENGTASGYPKAMSRSEIFPMARIVSVIDTFADRLAGAPADKPIQIPDLLGQLASESTLDTEAVRALELALTSESLPAAARVFAQHRKAA